MNPFSPILLACVIMITVEENGGIAFQGDALFRITGIVIQAFAALLALIGMFAVYKMQVIQNEISQLELLKNERLFLKKNDIDKLKLTKKQINNTRKLKEKAAQQGIEKIQKIHTLELELDYGIIPSEYDVDSIKNIDEEFIARQLQQLESKKEELTRHLDNINHTIEETEHDISEKKRKILQIREETKQTMKHVLIFLVFCLPILPLSSFEIINSLFRGYVSIFLMSLIILLSILVLLSIFRTLRGMI